VLVDTASVLLNGWTESALFRVTEAGEAYRIEEVWRTRALGFSLAASVPFEGHIYGYRGSFLSCLDAATGERVWRSRAPGAGALILVDGHLVILTGSGELVVAEASPAGFREKTRGSALEYGFYQRPSFARGRFFVRNLHEIARLDVTRAVPARVLAEPELVGEVGELVRALRAADDKARRIDEFLAAHPEMPILEGDTAHFLFRGEVEDLGLGGDLFAVEQPMHRVEGTNLYFRSVQLDPGARYEYYYSTFGEPRADPLNPHKTEAGSVKVSVLTTRGWEPPAHLRPPQGPRGRLETLSWDSELLGYPREVQVYLPPGYDEGAGRFPLLVVHGGDQALARGQMDRTLDNLIGTTVAPVVVAFVPEAHWSESMSGIAGYARALDEELIPLLDETYRTLARAEARGVMGAGSAAATSIYAVFDRPGVFGRLATQSLFMRDLGDDVHELIEAGNGRQLVLYLEWSRHDIQSIPRIDARAESKKVAEALERNGYDPVTHEAVGGSGWGGWRQRTDRVLESLFPWVEARAKAP
jgi:enterochelin esterase-like enzyme